MFHQIEGLVIEKNTHFGHLKHTIREFFTSFFDIPDLPIRFRPSFFPFTEPSAEVDIGYAKKDGELLLGEKGNWLEVLGCGMVHPTVLQNCGIDPHQYQGFAFGMGLERLCMLKNGITDIRYFFEGDDAFLKHYGTPLFA
jgi:phenylalanyl-tRNA synthetase alpha chain